MALVGIDEQLAADALVLQGGVQLLRLRQRHPGIVGPVDDEQRRSQLADVGERGRLVQEVEVGVEEAVLPFANPAAVGGCVVQERDQAGDADDVDAGGPPFRLHREPGQHHVSAVRTAVERSPIGVDAFLTTEPVVERGQVGHRVEPQPAIVEVLVPPAVSGRAADVRNRDRVAALDQ